MNASQNVQGFSSLRRPETHFRHAQGHQRAGAWTGSTNIFQSTIITVYEVEHQKTVNTKLGKQTKKTGSRFLMISLLFYFWVHSIYSLERMGSHDTRGSTAQRGKFQILPTHPMYHREFLKQKRSAGFATHAGRIKKSSRNRTQKYALVRVQHQEERKKRLFFSTNFEVSAKFLKEH